MIEAARSVLNRYIPDIYLYSDVYKGEDSGKSSRKRETHSAERKEVEDGQRAWKVEGRVSDL